uniref:Uncharacterized protein n=1 Tax=Anguilla anguilla TaxID=7936 RepID=A0A0E9WFA5_ANGAN
MLEGFFLKHFRSFSSVLYSSQKSDLNSSWTANSSFLGNVGFDKWIKTTMVRTTCWTVLC